MSLATVAGSAPLAVVTATALSQDEGRGGVGCFEGSLIAGQIDVGSWCGAELCARQDADDLERECWWAAA